MKWSWSFREEPPEPPKPDPKPRFRLIRNDYMGGPEREDIERTRWDVQVHLGNRFSSWISLTDDYGYDTLEEAEEKLSMTAKNWGKPRVVSKVVKEI